MVNAFRSIWQTLYPYGIFRADRRTVLTGNGEKPVAYLTFDDGPIPEVTPLILAILRRYGAKAAFFMVGENIDKHPEVFEAVVRDGHTVANHTYNHLKGFHCSTVGYLVNVAKCQEAIERHWSCLAPVPNRSSNPHLYRPPYGKATFLQRRALSRMGYKIVFWDILTRDYSPKVTPEQILAKVKRQIRPGAIINFHDSLKSAPRTPEILPAVIEYLYSQGYELLPLGID